MWKSRSNLDTEATFGTRFPRWTLGMDLDRGESPADLHSLGPGGGPAGSVERASNANGSVTEEASVVRHRGVRGTKASSRYSSPMWCGGMVMVILKVLAVFCF